MAVKRIDSGTLVAVLSARRRAARDAGAGGDRGSGVPMRILEVVESRLFGVE